MRLQKKHVWILILSLIIFYVILFIVLSTMPYYSKKIPLILGVENVESELIDKGDSWMVNYEVYKLSDTTVKNFLDKKSKELYVEEGYKKLNWRKIPMDSLNSRGMTDTLSYIEDMMFLSYSDNPKITQHVEIIHELFYNNSYYALHIKTINLFIVYTLDEKNNLLYITRYWL